MNIPDYVYNWLFDFFAGRSHSTRPNGITSQLLDISASIIQGSAVGPAASYVVNAADLTTIIAGTLIFKYADDMYIVIPAYNVSSRAAELDHVDRWAESNYLSLNRTKSAEIIFTDGRRNSNSQSASTHTGHSPRDFRQDARHHQTRGVQ